MKYMPFFYSKKCPGHPKALAYHNPRNIQSIRIFFVLFQKIYRIVIISYQKKVKEAVQYILLF
jgi:hypothetical protein